MGPRPRPGRRRARSSPLHFGNQVDLWRQCNRASAGRFHHAQSQIHRFLNRIGGYTYSVDDYSIMAGGRDHALIFGLSFDDYMDEQPHFVEISENTELVVALGACRSRTTRSSTEVRAVTCSARGWRPVVIAGSSSSTSRRWEKI